MILLFIIIGLLFLLFTVWGAIEGIKRLKTETFTSKRDKVFQYIWRTLFGSVMLPLYWISDWKCKK